MLRNLMVLLFGGLLGFASHLDAQIIRRAAFDFGSGCIRVHIADVDTENHRVLTTLYTDSIRVFLSEDLAKQSDKKFSEEIQKAAVSTAEKFKAKALELNATQFYGIATEAYRSALNGEELVKRYCDELSIPVEIVSKEEEGKLSFLTLALESNLNAHHMICCDIGGGSVQITYINQKDELKIYHVPYGRLSAKNALVTYVKPKNAPFLNPVSLTEWDSCLEYMQSALPTIPQDLLDKIKEPNVQLIGVAGHPPELASLGIYRVGDLIQLRDQYLGNTDQELKRDIRFFSAPHAVSDLILVCALMEKLGVHEISYFENNGSSNSTALLTIENLWQDS